MIETLITDVQQRITEFLEDEEARLLTLRTLPEHRMLAARVIAPIEEKEDGWVLCYGVADPFLSAGSFYEQLWTGLLAHLEESRAELVKQGIDLPLPDPGKPADRDGLPVEVWFVSQVEALTRILAPLSDRLLIVLGPETIQTPDAYRESLQRLCNATGSPRVRYIALDDQTKPILDGLVHQSSRYQVAARERWEKDLERQVGSWLRDPSQRVLALPGASATNREFLDQLQALVRVPANGRSILIHADAASVDEFYRQAHAALASTAAPPSATLVTSGATGAASDGSPTEPALSSLLVAEAQFACAAEEEAQKTQSNPLLVILQPRGLPDVREWIGSVMALAEEAVHPNVRYVVLDPEQALLETAPAPAAIPVVDLDLSAERIEQVLRQSITSPDAALSAEERIRYLSMLASFAVAREDYADALRQSGAAVELCELAGSAEDKAAAWLTMGNILYRMRSFELARNAYTKLSTLALEHKQDVMAAQGIENIGHTYFSSENYPQAAACYSTAQQYNAKLANVFGEGRALTWLGESERAQHQWDRAALAFESALLLYEDVRPELRPAADQARGEVLIRLAMLREQTGDTGAGKKLRQQAQTLGCADEVCRTP